MIIQRSGFQHPKSEHRQIHLDNPPQKESKRNKQKERGVVCMYVWAAGMRTGVVRELRAKCRAEERALVPAAIACCVGLQREA
jgi:hypothetical protein